MVEELFQEQTQFVNIILVAILFLLLMALAMITFFLFSRRKIVKTELEKANLEIEHQKEMLRSTIVTQEEERKRIAQDMHDAISSKLNVVSLNANMLKDISNSQGDREEIAENILKMTSTVLENSRRIAHDLLPPTLHKFGLEAALDELCEEVTATGRFVVKHSFEYPSDSLQEEDELHLFRIAQELFSNAIKYSEAKKIELNLGFRENSLHFEYIDDGKGFNPETAKKARGLGLSGIENRTVLMNGDLSIRTSPGEGLVVEITKQLA